MRVLQTVCVKMELKVKFILVQKNEIHVKSFSQNTFLINFFKIPHILETFQVNKHNEK